MTNNYLSASELASLIGCKQNSHACMRRWLNKKGWPFEENRAGFPQVSRDYHDARMHGQVVQAAQRKPQQPNFAALLT